jgi:hypothetical protein
MPGKDYDELSRERQAKRSEEYGAKERDRKIGGETLRLKANVPYGMMLRLADLGTADPLDTFQLAEDIIFDLLEGDKKKIDRARKFLRSNYTPEDLGRTVDELVGDVAARPTPAPESSGNGRAATGTSSKGASSSTPAEASTP